LIYLALQKRYKIIRIKALIAAQKNSGLEKFKKKYLSIFIKINDYFMNIKTIFLLTKNIQTKEKLFRYIKIKIVIIFGYSRVKMNL